MADLVAYLYSVRYFAESGDVQVGRRLLRSSGCLTCHSMNGQGANAAGNLAESTGMASSAEVISALWNHAVYTEAGDSLAVPWPVLSAEEMADIAAFLQTPRRE
jgi:mono/diheme cytochrome c family protein